MAERLKEIQIQFQKRNARKRGPTSSDQFNDTINEIAHDLTEFNTQWNNLLIPLTAQLPDGTEGLLASSVDAFINGLDGKTIFTDSRATSTTNTLYFNTTATRPNTLWEQLSDVYSTITNLQVNLENQISNNILTASQISISDNSSLFVSTNVEDALAEVMVKANIVLSANVLDLSAVAQHYLPATDDTFDIGSNILRIRDLFLGPASLNISSKISDPGYSVNKDFHISVNSTTNRLEFLDTSTSMMSMDSTVIQVDIDTSVPTLRLKELASSPAALSGFGKLYSKTDQQLYFRDSTGTEKNILLGSSTTANILALEADKDNNEANSLITLSIDGIEHWRVTTSGEFSSTSNQSILGTAGTPSKPAYSFNGDTDTGIYLPVTSALGFTVGAIERLRLTALANQTILGVSEVGANISLQGNITTETTPAINLKNSGSLSSATAIQNIASITGAINQTSTAGYTGLLIDIDESGIGSGAKNLIDLCANASSKFAVSNTGAVSIGNTLSQNNNIRIDVSGRYRASVGNASIPGYHFEGDEDTGIYRIAANVLGFSAGGNAVWAMSSTGDFSKQGSGQGRIALGNGIVTAPSLRFSTDTDTGIYLPGVNQLGFVTSGIERLTIDGTGNITASPGSQIMLDAGTNTNPGLTFANDPDTGIYSVGSNSIGFSTGTNLRWRIDSFGAFTGEAGTIIKANDGTNVAPSYSFANDPDTGIYLKQPNTLGFTTSGIIQWQIEPDGDLTANTTSAHVYSSAGTSLLPAHSFGPDRDTGMYSVGTNILGFATAGSMKWQIESTGALRGGLSTSRIYPGVGSAVLPSYGFEGDEDTGIYLRLPNTLTFSTAGIFQWQIDSVGDFGAGTANAHIYTGSGTSALPTYSFGADKDTGIYSSGSNQLSFSTTGTERMRIDNVGNVGIGTNTPIAQLDVSASFNTEDSETIVASFSADSDNASSGALQIGTGFSTATFNGQHAFIDAKGNLSAQPTALLLQRNIGNVGIGVLIPATKFHVIGTSRLTALETGGTTGTQLTVNSGVTAVRITPASITDTGLIVRSLTGQTADIMQVTDNAGTADYFKIDSAGAVTVGGAPISGGGGGVTEHLHVTRTSLNTSFPNTLVNIFSTTAIGGVVVNDSSVDITWGGASGIATINTTGVYEISTVAYIGNLPKGKLDAFNIMVNGIVIFDTRPTVVDPVESPVIANMMKLLTAGDTVEIRANSFSTSSIVAESGSTFTIKRFS